MPHAEAVEVYRLADDGRIPNNPDLPLIIYRDALGERPADLAAAFEQRFDRNGWRGGWRNGVYPYHHYHATTHEVLGIAAGEARVRFGGEHGPVLAVRAGDVVVIPAGVGHKSEGASADLLVVGAYPDGLRPDTCTGKTEEHAPAVASIARVKRPAADPVFGAGGPLHVHWPQA